MTERMVCAGHLTEAKGLGMASWGWPSCLKTWIGISRAKKEITGIEDRKNSLN